MTSANREAVMRDLAERQAKVRLRDGVERNAWYPQERTGICQWPMPTYGWDEARRCGNGGVGDVDGIRVCHAHRDMLARAALEVIAGDNVPRSLDRYVGEAIEAYLAREAKRADDNRIVARGLGALIAAIMRRADALGVDLGIERSLDDLVEQRLATFMGGAR